MPKYTIAYIRDQFEREGYKLLSNNYVNSRQKLEYICPKNHRHSITWNNWKNGHRCGKCARNVKYDIEYMRSEFAKEGYKLLSNNYVNNRQKLEYICPKNHRHSITWNNWKNGYRCGKCARNVKYDIDYIRREFEKEGYKLLTKNYKNLSQKLEFICPNGHHYSIRWGVWLRGHRCGKCANSVRLDIDFVLNKFEGENYQLLTKDYKNAFQKLKFVCPNNHQYAISWRDWAQGCRCSKCNPQISRSENELYKYVRELFPDTIQKDRTIVSPKELDIVIPSKKVAIEYCGLYWHSENFVGADYHLNKHKLCENNGFRLITIFEDEWCYKQDIVKSMLNNIFQIGNQTVIYARDCAIREIPLGVKNEFLSRNHIQGKDNSSIKFGAFYNSELVSVMTFHKGSIAKGAGIHNDVYELSRFCSKTYHRVVGIASKLLKYFINQYNPKEIFTFSDRRYSIGNLYRQLGFEFVYYTQPNYFYIVNNKRVHRFNFRKSVLSDKLADFNPELTEVENMLNNGYHRIFDCGHGKWQWKKW